MSYSDYGSLCWRVVPNGIPERYRDAEDASLHAPGPGLDRPMEDASGLKIDALVKAADAVGKTFGSTDDECDWLTEHAHHLVLGGMTGVALVSHKGSVSILRDGKVVAEKTVKDDGDGDFLYSDSGYEISGFWERFLVFLRFAQPDGVSFLAVCGYGVGEHWWKSDPEYAGEIGWYPTEQQFLARLVEWSEQKVTA